MAERKHDEWHKIASQEVVKVMSTKASCSNVELVNKVAVAYTSSGQPLFIDDRPWDPARMGDQSYVRRVAAQLNVAHILE